MPKLIKCGNEMLRISSKGIERSTERGHMWTTRYLTSSSCGTFVDLLPYENELLAVTSRGIYYSIDGGRTWNRRFMNGSSCGDFPSL